MNELIFLTHLFILISSLFIALRLGLPALVGLICVLTVLMNLFVIKTITLFGLTVTPTDAYAVSIMLGFNVIQEYYGKDMAQKTIVISFFSALVAIVLSTIQLWYAPAPLDNNHPHFEAILQFMPRITLASLLTYITVMYTDSVFYGFLKKKLQGRYLVARNYISISVGQLLDTVLFSFLGLYGIVPSIVPIIIVSYAIKIFVVILTTPFMAFTKIIFTPPTPEKPV